jgi:hypothetical protein
VAFKEVGKYAMTLSLSININAALKLATMLVPLALAGSAQVDPPPTTSTRADATKIITEARKIVNPGEVERL